MAPLAAFLKSLFGATAFHLSAQTDDLFEGLDAMEGEEGSADAVAEVGQVHASPIERTRSINREARRSDMRVGPDAPTEEVEFEDDDAAERERLQEQLTRSQQERLRPSAPRPGGLGPRPRRWMVPDR